MYFPCLTKPVCRTVVILTDNESHLTYYLTDFAVRRHKAGLVWCRFEIAVSGLVMSQVEVMIFRLTFVAGNISYKSYISKTVLMYHNRCIHIKAM